MQNDKEADSNEENDNFFVCIVHLLRSGTTVHRIRAKKKHILKHEIVTITVIFISVILFVDDDENDDDDERNKARTNEIKII